MADRFRSGNRFAGLDTSVKFGAWLRARFKECGVSVSDVAADIGVAPGTVYNWLKGKLPPPPRDGETDKFEEGLLPHPGLALSSSQREHLAERRRVLIGAAADAASEAVAVWSQRGLPTDVATFTGRYAQLDQLNRLLVRKERGNAVVISALSGMGGVGKTALAVHWAHTPEVRRTFPDGAVYVNLNGFAETEPTTSHEAQAQLLRQLGVKPQAIPLDPDAVTGLYHETVAGKGLLLVLDNARDEPQVRPLLPKDSRCLAVVTSRHRLTGLTVSHDATCLNLDALTPRESSRLLRRLLGGTAEREPDAVAALAEACAQLPLTLRIAAAGYLADPHRAGLGEYVTELAKDRLDKLAVGATDPATAIKTVLDRSYRILTPGARRALRLLACHPGTDWDHYAAAALLDADPAATETLLDELSDHSLLDTPGRRRYRMHDLTTEYARNHPDTDAAQREHALNLLWNYYRRVAGLAMDRYEPRGTGPEAGPSTEPESVPDFPDSARATMWLDAERANLLTTAAYCADNGESEMVREVAATIFRYLELAGHWRDGVALYTLECEHTAPDDRGGALNRLAVMRGRIESPGAARDLYEQALDLARRTADTASEIRTLNNLGVMSEKLGLFDDAVGHYQQAISAARAAGHEVSLGRALGNLGVVHIRRGEYELAAQHCRQALAYARDLGITSNEVFALNNLGTIFEAQGDLAAAADHYRRGLDLARHIGNRIVERACLTGLGTVSDLTGQFEQALRYHSEALRLTEQLNDQSGRSSVLNDLSVTLRLLDRSGHAGEHAREALRLATAVDNAFQMARAHDNIARTLAAQGETEAARKHWTEALRIFDDLDTPEAEEVRRLLAESATGPGPSRSPSEDRRPPRGTRRRPSR